MEKLEYTTIVAQEDPDTADARALLEELSAVLAGITGSSGRASFDVRDARGAAARFVVARDGAGAALGCGALRPLAGQDGVAELKRMYARPGRAGVGSAILAALEAEAAALGYRALWLETRLVNAGAVAFYQARGYRRIANYGNYAGNALAACFEKVLMT
ncbi:GNAT family N-acetyltransferase [Rugamonas sp. DEMB1]|uniref:GNAT family N-acetyltransferase n=1 Tax=Rugamonas sp. DEMB1 TaxID=3039386 RepID=UPI00244CE035|nr:GNAT family N-acetyltransferase [Rugamonas sp. DEMB1]WGG51887.1 GNAT family N-acetyltransferase [Rugamonas sp. DEMB1]